MKRCPKCQRTFPDDSPGFCVNDGAALVTEEAQGYDPQKTMLASAPPPPSPPQYSSPQPPKAAPAPPPQPVWPPPSPQQYQQQPQQQQGQNWGGGYYQQPGQQQQPYAMPYPSQAGRSNKLSLTAFILGCVSGLLGFLLFADYNGWMRVFTKDSGQATIIAAVVTGAIALVLGIIALISARQRSKPLAIVGMILGAASIAFYIYLESEYGIFF